MHPCLGENDSQSLEACCCRPFENTSIDYLHHSFPNMEKGVEGRQRGELCAFDIDLDSVMVPLLAASFAPPYPYANSSCARVARSVNRQTSSQQVGE